MSIRITDTAITSSTCAEVAHLRDGAWVVASLPGRTFTQNQAVTAMVSASALATNPPPGDAMWLHINGWRAELDLPPLDPTSHTGQGTASTPPRTAAVPCDPARSNGHEVPTS